MIGKLTGQVEVVGDSVLLETAGVGYLVHVTPSLHMQLSLQPTATVYTYTYVREDALELYGFANSHDLQLFELLLSVSGVGARIALAISDKGAAAISQAVQEADVTFFTQVPRVGKKLAQKIIIELKSKLGSITELELGSVPDQQQDAFQALQVLGYDEQRILAVLKKQPAGLDTKTAVTQALQELKA